MGNQTNTQSDNPSQKPPIVVGVDGSPSALLALEWAVAEAEVHGNPIHAISAYSFPAMVAASPGYAYQGNDMEDLAEQCRDALTIQIYQVAKDHPTVRICPMVFQGPAGEVLIEASPNAALLVVGSRGHGGLVGLMLGSVSRHCVTHAHCPVVVIHPREESTPDAAPIHDDSGSGRSETSHGR